MVLSPPTMAPMAPPNLIPAATGGAGGYSRVTATKPGFTNNNWNSPLYHTVICTTLTNNTGSDVVFGVSTYSDREGSSPAQLSTETLTGIRYTAAIPGNGGTVTVCVAALSCQQLDVFVAKGGGDTQLFSPPTTLQDPDPTINGANNGGFFNRLIAYAQTTGPGGADSCPLMDPLSQGYWKNHTENWNLPAIDNGNGTLVKGLALGNQFYTDTQLSTLISTPPSGGNATLILDKQLIAAKLNLLNGAISLPPNTNYNPSPPKSPYSGSNPFLPNPALTPLYASIIHAICDADGALVAAQTIVAPSQIPGGSFQISSGAFNPAAFVKTTDVALGGPRMNTDASILEAWQG